MANRRGTLLAAIAVCLVFLGVSDAARADELHNDVVEAGVAVGAIGAAIGIGVYLLIRHSGHTLTGCAAGEANSLQLHTEGDQQTYSLIGDVAGVTPGHRVRLSGQKKKNPSGVGRQFLVEKTSKDFGPCKAAATP